MKNNFLIIEYNELSSTQEEAKILLNDGRVHPNTAIATSSQTAGRAKNIRTWSSERGDLACTIILKPSKEKDFHAQITYIAAIAVSNAIEKFLPNNLISHKWVNDVLLENRKVSGILLEKYKLDFILVGIGVNILSKKFIAELNAIGLADIEIKYNKLNFKELLQVILEEFFKLYENWELFGFEKIRAYWLSKAVNLGKEITIKITDQSRCGVFFGIDNEGNLQLLNNQKIELIYAGDVFL